MRALRSLGVVSLMETTPAGRQRCGSRHSDRADLGRSSATPVRDGDYLRGARRRRVVFREKGLEDLGAVVEDAADVGGDEEDGV